MSENISKDGINISINNSDSSTSGGSFLDRIFNLGLRLLIPLLLVFAVFSIIVFFGVVLPLLEDVSGVITAVFDVALPIAAPLSAIAAGLGAIGGALSR